MDSLDYPFGRISEEDKKRRADDIKERLKDIQIEESEIAAAACSIDVERLNLNRRYDVLNIRQVELDRERYLLEAEKLKMGLWEEDEE